MEEAGSGDEKNAEKDEFLGVADLFGEEEKKATGDKDGGKEVGAEAEKKKESATEIGAGWADEVGFGVLGGVGVEGEVARIEGKEGEEQKDS